MKPSDEILLTRVEATMTVPVDLSTDLDQDAPPVLTEHEIVVSITSPNPPATLVNAIAYTLNAAVSTVVADPAPAVAEPGNGLVVIQGDPDSVRVVSNPRETAVLVVPPGVGFMEWPKGDDRG